MLIFWLLFGELVVKVILIGQTASYSPEGHNYLAGLFGFCQKDPETEVHQFKHKNQKIRWEKWKVVHSWTAEWGI